MINKQALKDEKRKYIKCRITDEMYHKVLNAAKNSGLCISDIMRLSLSQFIERRNKNNGNKK